MKAWNGGTERFCSDNETVKAHDKSSAYYQAQEAVYHLGLLKISS